jgi:serine/threonine-protein kinase RsbW
VRGQKARGEATSRLVADLRSFAQQQCGNGAKTVTHDSVVRLTIPAKAEYVSLCRLALVGLSRLRPLDDETLADLKLALTEACSNSVRHAYGGSEGQVEIVYRLSGDNLEVIVTDEGTGFEPAGSPPRDHDLSEGGLGIAIIRAIADEFDISPREGGSGSRLRFVKNLSGESITLSG